MGATQVRLGFTERDMIPKHAVSVWFDPGLGEINAVLTNQNGKEHTIKYAWTSEGKDKFLNMLLLHYPYSNLGTAGAPTQHQIDNDRAMVPEYDLALVRRIDPIKVSAEDKAKINDILRIAGLI